MVSAEAGWFERLRLEDARLSGVDFALVALRLGLAASFARADFLACFELASSRLLEPTFKPRLC